MQLKRVEITELQGINRNAVEGVTQTQPTEIKGFEFGRAGGYYAYYDSDTSNALVNSLSTSFISYDEKGLILFDNAFLHDDTLVTLSGTTVNALNKYLIPNVGVGANFNVTGADTYSGGAFAKDLPSGVFRDLPTVSGITVTATGTGGSIDDTLDHRIVVFISAPTEAGFLTYQALTSDLASGSVTAGDIVEVTLDTVLPRGYEVRAYLSDGFAAAGNPTKFLPEEPDYARTAYSNGEDFITITFTDDTLSGSTNDAFLSFDDGNGLIEPHLERVWGKAASDTLIGPYTVAAAAESIFYGTDSPPVARSINSGSSFDTALNSSSEFGVRVDTAVYPVNPAGDNYYYFLFHAPDPIPSFDDSTYLYFVKRENNSGNVQFGAGLRIRFRNTDADPRIQVIYYPFVEVNNVKHEISAAQSGSWLAPTSTVTVNGNSYYRYPIVVEELRPRVDFRVDLSTQTIELIHKDLNDNVIASYSVTSSTLASFLYSASDGMNQNPIDIFATDYGDINNYSIGSANPTSAVRWTYYDYQRYFALRDVEVHNTGTSAFDNTDTFAATGTSVAILDADDWNAATSTITDSVTSVEWKDYAEATDTSASYAGGTKQLLKSASPSFQLLNPSKTLLYSDIGHVNFVDDYAAFLEFQFLNSDQITALASTPAGLLVFGENETFLMRGDPTLLDSGNFSTQRLSGVIGCDVGKRPARLGGVVFVIYRGRLYGINLGMGDVDFGSGLQDVGAPVFDPEDPFEQVIGDTQSRHVIVRTQGNRVYRFSTITNSWMTDVFDEEDIDYFFPSIDTNGARYVLDGSAYSVTRESNGITPSIAWSDVDLGDKGLNKAWRRVRVYTGDDYSGTPTLEYRVNPDDGSTSTVTATEEGDGWWVFTFPSGIVAPKMDLMRVSMPNANFGDVFEPPVVIEFSERYRRR